MKYYFFIFLFALCGSAAVGQGSETWSAFFSKDSTLKGFRDQYGAIRIEPRPCDFTTAVSFDHIMAVTEELNGEWQNYYLTKSGRMVGRDSLHFFDNTPDCENEGFIRFRDPKTDKVGLFNRSGGIAIPAAYNYLSKVRNGTVVALKGATKRYFAGGEHYSFSGGEELLLDTTGTTLVDHFAANEELNFFSLMYCNAPNPDPTRQNFKATHGGYVSFVSFDKEFSAWLQTFLLQGLTKGRLLDASFKDITYWKEEDGWINEPAARFMEKHFDLIRQKLLQLISKDCDHNIFTDGLNPYIFGSAQYREYFDNCMEPKAWIFPVKNAVISYHLGKDLLQDEFDFLRTREGYKLFSVSIRKGRLE